MVKAADVHVERREIGAAEARGGAGEAAVDDLVRQPHGLEHLIIEYVSKVGKRKPINQVSE